MGMLTELFGVRAGGRGEEEGLGGSLRDSTPEYLGHPLGQFLMCEILHPIQVVYPIPLSLPLDGGWIGM